MNKGKIFFMAGLIWVSYALIVAAFAYGEVI